MKYKFTIHDLLAGRFTGLVTQTRSLHQYGRGATYPVDNFGTVVGENPDCLLLFGTVVGENPDHVCWVLEQNSTKRDQWDVESLSKSQNFFI